jgi:hypothetical protein
MDTEPSWGSYYPMYVPSHPLLMLRTKLSVLSNAQLWNTCEASRCVSSPDLLQRVVGAHSAPCLRCSLFQLQTLELRAAEAEQRAAEAEQWASLGRDEVARLNGSSPGGGAATAGAGGGAEFRSVQVRIGRRPGL